MEDTSNQQARSPAAPPSQYQPAAPPEQYYAPAAVAPPAPSPLDVADRVIRLLFRRLALLLLRLWRAISPRLGWVLLTTFLLGVIGALSLAMVLPRLISSAPAADTRAALIPPSPSVVDFLRGQQTYDADLMWESFSPGLRASLEEREITRDALADQMESERQAGHRYREVEYVGGVAVENRQTMYFYTVSVDSPVPERAGTFSYIFTVDGDGKIVSVKM